MTEKVITSFTSHVTGEGKRITYTYSEIDADGNIVKQNEKKSLIVRDYNILNSINTIEEFLSTKLEA